MIQMEPCQPTTIEAPLRTYGRSRSTAIHGVESLRSDTHRDESEDLSPSTARPGTYLVVLVVVIEVVVVVKVVVVNGEGG